MLRRRWLLPLACAAGLITAPAARAQSAPVVIELTRPFPTGPRAIRLEVLSERIVHVQASPSTTFPTRPSLIVVRKDWPAVKWSRRDIGDTVVISTARLTVRVNRRDGQVGFYDASGRPLLRDFGRAAKRLPAVTVMGEATHRASQWFDAAPDEQFYGLGEHQDGFMGLRGHTIDLWQWNSTAPVPFLVSSRDYGILWDNASHTTFGPRYDQAAFPSELVDHDGAVLAAPGRAGALTGEYFADRTFTRRLAVQRDTAIAHHYTDVPSPYPAAFDPNNGSIRWTGELVAARDGQYSLRLWSSEYVKLWVQGKLVLDSWRQNWHPLTDDVDIPVRAGERVPIRLEWVPNGGYLGVRMRTPIPPGGEIPVLLESDVADAIDYYFVRGDGSGTLDGVIRGYRELTGQVPMMPKWAWGLWQSRERYQTQDSVLSVVRTFRRLGIPFDNIVQDWFYWPENAWGSHDFDLRRYPDAAAMVDTLHRDLHTQIMISVWPKFYVGIENYQAMADSGFLYTHTVQTQQKDWVGSGYVATFYDAFNPRARDLYFDQVRRKLVVKGFDGWWLDSDEPDLSTVPSPAERLARMAPLTLGTAARYENAYPLVHTGGFYEHLRQVQPNRRAFILSRSAFAGQQRYGTAIWSGDVASRWEALRTQIATGLNYSVSGLPYWTTDIGGFAPEQRYVQPDAANLDEWRELMTRWFQFGTFCPLLRAHGEYPYREMFNVAPPGHPTYEAMLSYDRLRYRLMPYLYGLAGMVTQDAYTPMRALVMDFPRDARARTTADEYMFGPAILVAPVTAYRARARAVYLPAGGWYELGTGRFLAGARTVQADAPLAHIPLFARAGSIVPFGPALQYATEKPADPIRLHVYTGRDGAFALYEDQDTTYDYEHGAFSRIPIAWHERTRTLSIGARQGSFPGMLPQRTFEVVWVTPQHAAGLDFERAPERVVRYDGRAVSVKAP